MPADVAGEKLFDNWFDPIETELRAKVRGFIEAMIEEDLETALARPRYGRRSGPPVEDDAAAIAGHRHGRRIRSLTGTFGRTEIAVPRARIFGKDRKTTEWKSRVMRSYQRRTRAADALIASAYLSLRNQHPPGPPGAGGPVRWRRGGKIRSAGSGAKLRAIGMPGTPVPLPKSQSSGWSSMARSCALGSTRNRRRSRFSSPSASGKMARGPPRGQEHGR